jgi:hypothetical protein
MRIVAVASTSNASDALTTRINDVGRLRLRLPSRRPSVSSSRALWAAGDVADAKAKASRRRRRRAHALSSVRSNITAATLGLFISVGVHAAALPASAAEFYIEDVPLGLNAAEDASTKRPSLRALTSGKNGKAIEKCANKCIATCSRGGSHGGAPGLGPMSVRRDPIVFKESFRSRNYCLFECADICAAKINGAGDKR